MQVRLTTLNKGEYFELFGFYYKKLEDREKGDGCENVKTGEVRSFPLMSYVNKISEEEAKNAIKKKVKKSAASSDDSNHTISSSETQPDTPRESKEDRSPRNLD